MVFHNYNEALERCKLPTLADRRHKICKEFYASIQHPENKLYHLLPCELINHHDTRFCKQYPTPKCRTERYKNSFIPFALFNFQ